MTIPCCHAVFQTHCVILYVFPILFSLFQWTHIWRSQIYFVWTIVYGQGQRLVALTDEVISAVYTGMQAVWIPWVWLWQHVKVSQDADLITSCLDKSEWLKTTQPVGVICRFCFKGVLLAVLSFWRVLTTLKEKKRNNLGWFRKNIKYHKWDFN